MNEKKKLLAGIAAAVFTAGLISGIMSGNPFAKKKTTNFGFVGDVLDSFKYDLNVSERKTAKEYEPLDMKKIETRLSSIKSESDSLKVEEIKNNRGEITGTKDYKKNGTVVVTVLEKGKIISTETIEKIKNNKYDGKAELVYSDGVKQTYTYKKGIKEGAAEILFNNGDREQYIYKNDVPEGKAAYYFSNGDKEIYSYKNGVLEGEAEYIYADGRKETYKYINGERQ